MARILSGMRPTGKLHLGHLFGAIKNWMKLQMQKRVLPTSLAALPCVAGLAPVQGT